MIIAVDGHYEEERAQIAGGLFYQWEDEQLSVGKTVNMAVPDEYIPGEFYRRELPCILALLDIIVDFVDTIVVDSYVRLAPDHPGLGHYLWEALDRRIPVIGVAKSKFRGSDAIEVFRGKSRRPLFVTAVGMDEQDAADAVRRMAGKYRIPTLLKEVDRMARGNPLDDSQLP